jgi:transcriptional regulator with XRE-family HTH domain
VITGLQMRMARAALGWSCEDLAGKLGVSKMAVSKFESRAEGLGRVKVGAAEGLFGASRIFFGPGHAVAVGQDVFAQERWLACALMQLVQEAGLAPGSRELIEAARRAEELSP